MTTPNTTLPEIEYQDYIAECLTLGEKALSFDEWLKVTFGPLDITLSILQA